MLVIPNQYVGEDNESIDELVHDGDVHDGCCAFEVDEATTSTSKSNIGAL